MKFKTDIIIDGSALAKLFKVELTANQSVGPGEIAWNPLDGTFDLGLLNGVKLQSGQELHFYGKATETISSGDAVMFAGVQGDHILIAKADRSVINGNPNYFIGIATQNFTVNEFGYVTSFGKVRELDTSSYTLGSVLYFDSESSTPGLLTSTMPNANQAKIEVAAVVGVHSNQGILMVRTHIMPMLNEIQDVDLTLSKTTPLNADNILIQDSEDQSIWKKLSWGNIKATLKTYFDSLYQKGSGTTNYVAKFTGTTSLGDSQIFDNGTNVGIGTTTPTAKLHVTDANKTFDGYGNVNIFTSDIATTNIGGSIALGGTNSSGGTNPYVFAKIQGIKESSAGNYKGALIFGTTSPSSAVTEKMRITSIGYVGIGTSSPASLLHINNLNTNPNALTVGNNNNGAIYGCATGGNPIIGNYSGDLPIQFGYFSGGISTTFTERMRINPGGNVGIGTTSPGGKLHVVGEGVFDDGTNGRLTFANASGQNDIYSTTTGFETYKDLRISSNELILSTGGTAERMRITSSGNVGIGITTPDASALLDLKSTTRGFLPPRMDDTEMNSISSPVDGLMIFNTDANTICVYISSAGGWKKLTYA